MKMVCEPRKVEHQSQFVMVWSAENATRAYLSTMKLGNKGMEPNVAEFVSALAAGSGACLMIEACSGPVGPTTLALAAAARQTGGRVICILPNEQVLEPSIASLDVHAKEVELTVGDASTLLMSEYRGADFVLIDCLLELKERVFEAARVSIEHCGGVMVGYNVFSCKRPSWVRGICNADLLPIGDGLRFCRVPARRPRRSKWVVRVDERTGEEHVYRIMT